MKAETPFTKKRLKHIIDSFSRIRMEPYHNKETLRCFSLLEIIRQAERIQMELFGEVAVTALLENFPCLAKRPFDSESLCRAYSRLYKREILKMIRFYAAEDLSSKEKVSQAFEEIFFQASLLSGRNIKIVYPSSEQCLLGSGRGKESLGA